MAPKGSRNAFELLSGLIRDLLKNSGAHELAESILLPAQTLFDCLRALEAGDAPPWTHAYPIDLPLTVWSAIREKHPAAASFPLGSVAERAIKRYLGALIHPGGADGPEPGAAKPEADLTPPLTWKSFRQALRGQPPDQRLGVYLGLWLFEAAMLNLRGSSKKLEDDFGFWYHRTPGGHWRTLRQEAKLREELAQECQRQAPKLLACCSKYQPAGSGGLNPQSIACAFQELFELVLPGLSEEGDAPRQRPVSVLGVKPSPGLGQQNLALAEGAQKIIVRGRGANVHLDTSQLLAFCGGKLHGLLQDLLEIAATVYLADIHVRRDRLFARDLVFLMPVRYPEVWSAHAESIARPVSFLTGNTAEFRWLPAPRTKREPQAFTVASEERCVTLFSGGLDSFVGATHLLQDRRYPVLISHVPGPGLAGIQQRLVQAIRERHPSLVSVSVPVSAARAPLPENQRLGPPPPQVLYQYARSFLFLAIATCAAIEQKIADLYVYENGLVMHNPVFSEARFNTRTTHPTLLEYFRVLIQKVFGVELHIHDPFAMLTKAEVLQGLEPKWRENLRSTNSCWGYSKVRVWSKQFEVTGFDGAHCGRCIPCIWRQAAFRHAGLQSFDDDYLSNHVPSRQWLDRQHLTVILDLVRFSQNALERSDKALLDLCPDLYEGAGMLSDRLAMVRRFAGETVEWSEHSGLFRKHSGS